MKRVFLLYNPASGPKRQMRLAQVEAARRALAATGIETATEPTWRPGSASEQARDAIASGFDTILVGGGDGTVNEALQAMVGSPAILGVIPLGTANVLANDIGIPRDPADAARTALNSIPRKILVARICSARRDGGANQRYFLSTAGIGADAELVYRLALGFKASRGMASYYAEAWRQWATYSYPGFRVEFPTEGEAARQMVASQVLAVRITQFGGVLRHLAPGAALHKPDLQLVIFNTRSRWPYLHFMTRTLLERRWRTPHVELANASELSCSPLDSSQRIYAEADGELVGVLPVSIAMSQQFVRLLVPPSRRDFADNDE